MYPSSFSGRGSGARRRSGDRDRDRRGGLRERGDLERRARGELLPKPPLGGLRERERRRTGDRLL